MSDAPAIHSFSHDALGSKFWVRIADEDAVYARNAAAALFQRRDEGAALDVSAEAGLGGVVNALGAGATTQVTEDFRALWDFAATLHDDTGGAFDCLATPLFQYWTARGEAPFDPEDRRWADAMRACREGRLVCEGASVTCVRAGRGVDFGAVIRGFALDRMADLLENTWGIHRALIMASGSVTLTLDPPGDSNGWRIGVGTDKEMRLCRYALASRSRALVDARAGIRVSPSGPVRALATSALEAQGLAAASVLLSAPEVEDLVNRGCSRGAWLSDGTKSGSLGYYEIADRA
ncbi:MAG: FAD:protein FMN transferase [Opitutales bacterium]